MNGNSISQWLQEYDRCSLGKAAKFDPISSFDSIAAELPLFFQYPYVSDQFFASLQKKMIDLIQIFQQTLDELASFPDELSQEFAKIGVLSLQCERFYCQESWKTSLPTVSLMNCVAATFFRLRKLFYSIHKTLLRTDSSRFRQFILWKTLQSTLLETLDSMIKSLKPPTEFDFTNFLEVLRSFKHYIEYFLKKNHEYLLQETLNLFGEEHEKKLLERIINRELTVPGAGVAKKRPSNSPLLSNENGIDEQMKKSIFQGFSAFFKRESNFHELSELRIKEDIDLKDENRKKNLTSVFETTLLENYPCLNDKMNGTMAKILQDIENFDKCVRQNSENMIRSVKNSTDLFEDPGKKSENGSKSISRNESIEDITIKSDQEEDFMKLSDLDAKLVSLTKNQPVKKFPLPNGKLLVSQSFQIEEHKKELSPENKKKTLFQKNSLIKAQGT